MQRPGTAVTFSRARLGGCAPAAIRRAHLGLCASLRAAHAAAPRGRHTAACLAGAGRRTRFAQEQRATARVAGTGLASARCRLPGEATVAGLYTAGVGARAAWGIGEGSTGVIIGARREASGANGPLRLPPDTADPFAREGRACLASTTAGAAACRRTSDDGPVVDGATAQRDTGDDRQRPTESSNGTTRDDDATDRARHRSDNGTREVPK